jgi:hypothetical protein
MRASNTILGKIGAALLSPEGSFCAMWHFAPFVTPVRTAHRAEAVRRGSEDRR